MTLRDWILSHWCHEGVGEVSSSNLIHVVLEVLERSIEIRSNVFHRPAKRAELPRFACRRGAGKETRHGPLALGDHDLIARVTLLMNQLAQLRTCLTPNLAPGGLIRWRLEAHASGHDRASG